ncbi:hypothetical protein [Sphingobium vermicomposti]|uniref:Uncharacterized protein n=1 Tax=Sphingobium vermicomposti TaxID=529005 RepID=A0A846M241_9SPHN|nr:hypothetical protein [Sphingobium vermicomposti]NIJ16217.1 hypothetical protein [Sphingobium vermicomposti]
MPAKILSHDRQMMTRWKQIDPGKDLIIALELHALARPILKRDLPFFEHAAAVEAGWSIAESKSFPALQNRRQTRYLCAGKAVNAWGPCK